MAGGKLVKIAPKKNAVQELKKEVKKLKKLTKQGYDVIYKFNYSGPTNLSSPYYIYPMNQFDSFVDCFGTGTTDDDGNKAQLKSHHIKFRIEPGAEKELIGYTVFLVKLKDEASGILNLSTGALDTLVAVDEYITQNGLAYLNPKLFTVIKQKSFHTTNYGTAQTAPSQNNNQTMWEFDWKVNTNIEIINPSGSWDSLQAVPDVSKNYYLIVFNDNLTADVESPTIDIIHLLKFHVAT